MSTRARIVIPLVLLLAAAAGGLAYEYYRSGANQASGEITLYGNVDIREADLAFNITGRVESMLVEEGDTVSKGQLLATLEPNLYAAEVNAAKARMEAQKAVLDRLLAGSRTEEIDRARSNVDAIQVQLDNAKRNLLRTEKLVAETIAPTQKLEDDRTTVQRLEAELQVAKQEVLLAVKGPRQEDIVEARAQLRGSDADLALSQQRLSYTELYAKEDGVVTTRIDEPGAVVQPQSTVYTVALNDPVWVRTYIGGIDLGRIHPGMKATIFTDSRPDRPYSGWVGFISPTAEFTPKTVQTREVRTNLVYRLRVFVKNPDQGLRQGMPVTIRLEPEPEPEPEPAAPGAGN